MSLTQRVSRLEAEPGSRRLCAYCRRPLAPPPTEAELAAEVERWKRMPREEFDREYRELMAEAPLGQPCGHCGRRQPSRFDGLIPSEEEMQRMSYPELLRLHRETLHVR